MNTVKLNGSNYLRQRIILATLSGKSLKITKIRESESNPGVTEEEMNLLRLVERPVSILENCIIEKLLETVNSFTNGTTIKVNETGTVLFYSPGMLTGGTVTHKCHKARAVSYYLEVRNNKEVLSGLNSLFQVLLALGPFCSNNINFYLQLAQQSNAKLFRLVKS